VLIVERGRRRRIVAAECEDGIDAIAPDSTPFYFPRSYATRAGRGWKEPSRSSVWLSRQRARSHDRDRGTHAPAVRRPVRHRRTGPRPVRRTNALQGDRRHGWQ